MPVLGMHTNRRTTTIGNLYSNIQYQLRVRAVNAKGVGEASSPSRGVITLPKAPTKMVQNVTGGGGKEVSYSKPIISPNGNEFSLI